MLVALRRSLPGADPKRLGDEGDRRSHALIGSLLEDARPDDPVLSEEGVDNGRRLSSDRVWIVDPLDGTHEYSEGRHDWAVHVALWAHGDLVAGAVALPGLGPRSASGSPSDSASTGLLLDRPPHGLVDRTKFTWGAGPEEPVPPRAPATSRMVVSRTRPPDLVADVARQVGLEPVGLGSAGAKIMAVVLGEADAYVHAGGQYEWDSAAPVAVARRHGLHTSRVDGSPLAYNRPDPLLPDIVVCRPELAEALLAALARARAVR